jgi:alanine-glyoxylate transaminase/serine-glyoxylate transaminase/serine-pyruvate transaminase
MIGREFLHTPGPTHIPQQILNAMNRQPLDLVDGRLKQLAKSCFEDMKEVFRTAGSVFIYAANGHGGWEAVLANLFVPGDTVLLPVVGHFADAWGAHARALGIHTEIIEGDWRQGVDPAQIEERLRRDTEGRIKAVLAVQVDTATSLACDIQAVRCAIDAAGHPALLVVDTVASLAAMPFDMDAWGVDVALTASQKALMCPPGLAIVAANDKAVEVARSTPRNQHYWDWTLRVGDEYYTKFCGTMPEHHLFALRTSLDLIKERGLEAIFRSQRQLAGAVHQAVEAWSQAGALELNVRSAAERAPTVTTVRTAAGIDPDRLRTYARERLGLALAGGLGQLGGKAFRIGHMGSINEPMILGCLATLDLALKELGLPHGDGAVQAAIAHLARERAAEA